MSDTFIVRNNDPCDPLPSQETPCPFLSNRNGIPEESFKTERPLFIRRVSLDENSHQVGSLEIQNLDFNNMDHFHWCSMQLAKSFT